MLATSSGASGLGSTAPNQTLRLDGRSRFGCRTIERGFPPAQVSFEKIGLGPRRGEIALDDALENLERTAHSACTRSSCGVPALAGSVPTLSPMRIRLRDMPSRACHEPGLPDHC
jgi:hypothetical protein